MKNEAKMFVLNLLALWVKNAQETMDRLRGVSKKRREAIEKIARKKVQNRFLRWGLKLVDYWFCLLFRRITAKIGRLEAEIKKMKEALSALEKDNPDPAIEILRDRLSYFPQTPAGSDLNSFLNESSTTSFLRLIDDLKER